MCIVLLLFSYTRTILVYENNIKKDYTCMPMVSIIIPVYNVEKYLPKCLYSLVNQTLSDIEIICVNDGSTDSSLNILEQFAIKDSAIKILNLSYRPWRLPNDEAKKLMGEIKLFLPDKYYKAVLYKSMILSFLYRVFSVYNEYKDGFKYKVFSIFGIKFYIRK